MLLSVNRYEYRIFYLKYYRFNLIFLILFLSSSILININVLYPHTLHTVRQIDIHHTYNLHNPNYPTTTSIYHIPQSIPNPTHSNNPQPLQQPTTNKKQKKY